MQKVKQIFSNDNNDGSQYIGKDTGTIDANTSNSRKVGTATNNGQTGLTHGRKTSDTVGSPRSSVDSNVSSNDSHGTHSTAASSVNPLDSSSVKKDHHATANTGGVGSTERRADGLGSHSSSPATNQAHTHNTQHNSKLDEAATAAAAHDHRHLAAVTQEVKHHHETEEVTRERTHDKHIHHVQHHVQPLIDEQHADVQHTNQVHPVSKVREQHVNTEEDHKLFAGLGHHKDTTSQGKHERTVIDKGEIVNENTHHHVHHIVQPIIQRDAHTHSTIHTTIPVHHETHEAPIIHQSASHSPMHVKDFLAGGGDLKSKLTHKDAGVLQTGDCERNVDGPVENLVEQLHLGSGSSAAKTGQAV